jgi:6-phosphofructokinase
MSLRVGVFTGGGDAPGLNAAICGLGRRLLAAGATLVGFRDGWRGLIEDSTLGAAAEAMFLEDLQQSKELRPARLLRATTG